MRLVHVNCAKQSPLVEFGKRFYMRRMHGMLVECAGTDGRDAMH